MAAVIAESFVVVIRRGWIGTTTGFPSTRKRHSGDDVEGVDWMAT
jgi:hypothetical protein